MTTTTFIAPHQAIQGAIDRAYSIHVMYREAIRVPHATPGTPDIGTPGSRLRAKMAKLNIHQVFTPIQTGGHKRDFRILKANRAPRAYYEYRPAHTFEDGYVMRVCRGEVSTATGDCKKISHVPYKAGVRRHREGC